jgi:hypothetical protein
MFLSGSTYVTYEDGSRADVATGVYNHHIAVVDVGKTNILPFDCKWNMTAIMEGVGSGFLATGATMGGAKGHEAVAKHALSRLSKRQIGLPGSPVSQIFGSGDDGSALNYFANEGNFKAGYYIGKNDIMLHTTEVINYKNTSQTIYLTADVEYVPGRPSGWSDAVMGAVSAVGCMPFGYCQSLPPRRQDSRQEKLTDCRSSSVQEACGCIRCIQGHYGG